MALHFFHILGHVGNVDHHKKLKPAFPNSNCSVIFPNFSKFNMINDDAHLGDSFDQKNIVTARVSVHLGIALWMIDCGTLDVTN